nr:MAG TPA: hypothetical protein [Caudoviricetes sp.]
MFYKTQKRFKKHKSETPHKKPGSEERRNDWRREKCH